MFCKYVMRGLIHETKQNLTIAETNGDLSRFIEICQETLTLLRHFESGHFKSLVMLTNIDPELCFLSSCSTLRPLGLQSK